MGTNFYLHDRDPCDCCGRPFSRLHIGKSSAGRAFSLHVIPEEGIHGLKDWEARWSHPHVRIEDEYGQILTPQEMHDRIANRSWCAREPLGEAWYRETRAEAGPNGLARSVADGVYCVGHGPGTWDLIAGEFS